MNIEFSAVEARVIACLLEKETTTPEQYPLSLNGLTTACNQKSNREPVMSLSEGEVQEAVDSLMKKHFVSEATGFGARVVKYKHRFCNSDFGGVQFNERERGVLCVLMLRGAQTPGELRTRTNRLCSFSDVAQTEQVLNQLATREDGPFVVKLPREPGRRESRYMHLFSGEVDVAEMAAAPAAATQADRAANSELEIRITELESTVDDLRAELQALKQQLGAE